MNEESARYAAEFVLERLSQRFVGRLGELSIAWRPGAAAQERDCCVFMPLNGVHAASSMIEQLVSHLGLREISFSCPGECLWMSRRLVPAGSFGMLGRKPPCLVSLWSHASLELPPAAGMPLSEFSPDAFDFDHYGDDPVEDDFLFTGDRAIPDDTVHDSRAFLRRIAAACGEHADYHELLLSPFRQDSGDERPAGVIAAVHGITSLIRAQQLIRSAIK
ncbi:MAG TPA: hypothetical protein PLP17_14775, partial [Oligoflexia bacterium]|nr:hypothetical protein [Oligoflexia bacterium]